ncbi:MAG: type II toxin-antitoxin system HicA family toxin [Armatimonadetes bacterium]|nr:type II toxin-antitoxin system HicA family toxin [Armatimonadota bacterium]NCQ30469.1 type II toxin-antitoxin system HicA family toxin [Armatimonadota bacterium]NDK15701.1 type II toxin-antitoxin system HicA family toxin [Armatimonadota bacterium]
MWSFQDPNLPSTISCDCPGRHRQFRHPTKPGQVTVPGHPSDDLAPGTLNSIRLQAGLKACLETRNPGRARLPPSRQTV